MVLKMDKFYRKKLWFADVGLSQAFGNDFNKIQVLEIKNGVPRGI